MHKLVVIVSRLLLAPIFIYSGQRNFRNPGPNASKAAKVVPEQVAFQAVRANAAFMVVGATAMALGIKARPAALGLVGSLVPTTLAGHPFWEEQPGPARANQTTQFTKNLGLMGALLLVAAGSGKHTKRSKKA